jgi:hypothetical protein
VVDYYPQRGLRLDPADYQIGAGTGVWVETDFADARLEVSDDGMQAAALFTDGDGLRIEVLRRRPGRAPWPARSDPRLLRGRGSAS